MQNSVGATQKTNQAEVAKNNSSPSHKSTNEAREDNSAAMPDFGAKQTLATKAITAPLPDPLPKVLDLPGLSNQTGALRTPNSLTIGSTGPNRADDANASCDMIAAKGHLVIVGGNVNTDEITRRTLELAGGPEARVVLLPQALYPHSDPELEAAKEDVEMWREAGAKDVQILSKLDANAIATLKKATLVWMGGGDQIELMKAIRGAGALKTIRELYMNGAVISGTSAGAAVMSDLMIERNDQDGNGLGLWPGVVVDMHFIERERLPRLERRIVNHSEYLGVGIDESTAVFFSRGEAEVVGKGHVTIVNGRDNAPLDMSANGLAKIKIDILKDGQKSDLPICPSPTNVRKPT